MIILTPTTVRFAGSEFWAENGFIRETTPSGHYRSHTVKVTLERLEVLNMALRKGRQRLQEDKNLDKTMFDARMRFIEQMIELCRKAKEQGTPDDPTAVRDRVLRAPTTVLVDKSVPGTVAGDS